MVPEPFSAGRIRSAGQIIDGAMTLYQAYPALFAVLALGVIAPYELIVLAITGDAPFADHTLGTSLLLGAITTVLVYPLVSAMHIHAVVEIDQGRKPRLGGVARRGLAVLPVVAATDVMAGLGILGGFVLLIVPGVLLSLRWAVAAQAAALDHEGWLEALHSSRALTRKNYLHIFGLTILVSLITGAAVLVPRLIVGTSADALNVVLGIAVYTVTSSFSALTSAVLYFDLVARQHGSGE